jgi:signal transduction histidine kinase
LEIKLEVTDDGKGIDKHLQSKSASSVTMRVGFRGMQERVKLMGGKLAVQSGDHGTLVAVTLPWNNDAETGVREESVSARIDLRAF